MSIFFSIAMFSTSNLFVENTNDVEMIFISTKNEANCTIIKHGENAIMIDAGEKADSEKILKVIRDNEIKKLDYLILTHHDKDHIGSALDVINTIEVDKIISSYYREDNEIYDAIVKKSNEKDIFIAYPTVTQKIVIGDMRIVIYPPVENTYRDTNNYSLAISLKHKNVNVLFTGDALRKRTEELMLTNWQSINLLVVPHHGRENSASEKFFRQISPDMAVVTSDKADRAIMDAALEIGCDIYFSLLDDYTFISNGEKVTCKT